MRKSVSARLASPDAAADATAPGVPLAAPLYKEIKRHFMDALTPGEWKPGEAIPAERRLSERFGISIGTVRKAIDELVRREHPDPPAGTRHLRREPQPRPDAVLLLPRRARTGPKAYPGRAVPVVRAGQGRPDRRRALELDAGDAVFRIRNRLRLGGAPIIIDDITLPVARFPGLTEAQFRERPSTIYNLYQEAFGISVVRTSERLRATLAEADVAACSSFRAARRCC